MNDIIPALMMLLVPLMFFGFFGGIIALIIYMNVNMRRQQNEVLRRLAGRLGGELREGDLFTSPSLRFLHHGVPARLDYFRTGGKNSKWYTQLHIAWPDPAFRCVVYPQSGLAFVGKLLGMTDIEIGYPQFDADYVISGQDLRGLRAALNPEAQRLIEELRRFGSGDLHLAIQGGRMQIRKRGMFRDWNTLRHFTVLGLQLFDAARGQAAAQPDSAGIEFVVAEAVPLEAPICQICGDAIETEEVFCRGCRTPHHADCWEYYGRCSVYGCTSTTYYRPRSAPAAAAPARKRGG